MEGQPTDWRVASSLLKQGLVKLDKSEPWASANIGKHQDDPEYFDAKHIKQRHYQAAYRQQVRDVGTAKAADTKKKSHRKKHETTIPLLSAFFLGFVLAMIIFTRHYTFISHPTGGAFFRCNNWTGELSVAAGADKWRTIDEQR